MVDHSTAFLLSAAADNVAVVLIPGRNETATI
eukprot:CAMPEP_0201894692 /NCGR_PEP_ID=MMETSP0902-20130614/41206_1 /ASSEMBLY_ACC=CAM_ASM_000551 /TAXON_ID=420261 /ORGANISM="Thalassiosira antarctica, Strain CCMP982" /LENGTH=31 /DNA_ID= /DNA_START= /DNA_END= /DNA_ORIENTATION=